MARRFTADFETTTDENDCRVWVYGVCEIGNTENFTYGTSIDEFMNYLETSKNATYYFHNLKFDGAFILTWLFNNGFKHVIRKDEQETKTFSTLISDKGMFYSIKITFKKQGHKTNSVTIYDSLKILPFSVAEIAKAFGLPCSKGDIDYDAHNGDIKPVTEQELDYLRRDVTIPAMALDVLFKQGLDKMTQGSNAFSDYKKMVNETAFKKWFPTPDYFMDYDIRQSYKGGFTYLNPLYKEIMVEHGIVLDVNSLYPWVMHDCPLPYGEGLYFKGRYKEDKVYNLYVQMFKCNFELKDKHIPTIQIKKSLAFIPTEYLTSSNGEDVTLTLTSVDLELFYEHYEVYNEEWLGGWKFKSTIGLFSDYIDKWTKVKIESTLNGNLGMRTLAKLMLNALYGKLALNPNVQGKIPYMDEDGVIRYELGEKETRNAIYIPCGTFITAWARHKTITSAQKVYDRFVYADTDSLHLIGTEIPEGLEVDEVELGKWKHESTFLRARFIRQKSYIETEIISDKAYNKMTDEQKEKCYEYEGVRVHNKVTCAGMPTGCHEYVTWNNFVSGEKFTKGKKQAVHVKGGVVLKDIDFTIKK